MLYREAGQFKSSYAADGQIFPIRQDRIGIMLLLAIAFVLVPQFATPYLLSAILVPFLIFSPNNPSGRTSKNSSASTYGNQPSIPPPTKGPM